MTSSRLSVADVAGEVPRIAARAVLAKFFFFGKGSLLRNEPQYPTTGYAPHSGRGGNHD